MGAAERIRRALDEEPMQRSPREVSLARCVDVAYETSALLLWIETIHAARIENEGPHRYSETGTLTLSSYQAERLFALANKVREAYGA